MCVHIVSSPGSGNETSVHNDIITRARNTILNGSRTRLHDERIPEVEYSIFQHFRVSRRSGPSTIVDPLHLPSVGGGNN